MFPGFGFISRTQYNLLHLWKSHLTSSIKIISNWVAKKYSIFYQNLFMPVGSGMWCMIQFHVMSYSILFYSILLTIYSLQVGRSIDCHMIFDIQTTSRHLRPVQPVHQDTLAGSSIRVLLFGKLNFFKIIIFGNNIEIKLWNLID